jgi:glycosyltransferase involved in cell wall biosynthesis
VGDLRLQLSLDVSAVPDRPVGAGQYTARLASALSARTDLDLVLFSRRGDGPRWRTGAPGAGVAASAPAPRPLRLAWEQGRLPALLSRRGVDVHHGPHYTMPERSRVPTVVTVHDLSFFEEPAWHQRSKVLVFRRAIKVAARRAQALVCPSRITAEQLARWCRLDARVFVAPHGVDTARFRPDEPSVGADEARLAAIDARLSDGRPFLVFVGTIEPRKNVPALVEAFARVARDRADALLVLAGGAGWGADAVDRAIRQSGIASSVVRTGYVPDQAVPALLRSATAAVYPALYEGFGLPALEALACGARLVTTAGTAMEEVAGEAAVLVDPGDPAGLADAIGAVLARPPGTGTADRDRRRRGLEVAARHTWASSAGLHVEAYRYAAAAGHGPRGEGSGTHPVG